MNRQTLGILATTAVAAAVAASIATGSGILWARADDAGAWIVIGDSHSAGTFGKTLDRLLRERFPRARVSYYGTSGATPKTYLEGESSRGGFYHHPHGGPLRQGKMIEKDGKRQIEEAPAPKIHELLEREKPAYTVIELGANLYRAKAHAEGRGNGLAKGKDADEQFRRLIQLIRSKGSRCFWAGPPDEAFVSQESQIRFVEQFKKLAKELDCPYIDGRQHTRFPPNGGDQAHYDSLGPEGVAMAQAWARQVLEALQGLATEGPQL